jgi:hypothetical protein
VREEGEGGRGLLLNQHLTSMGCSACTGAWAVAAPTPAPAPVPNLGGATPHQHFNTASTFTMHAAAANGVPCRALLALQAPPSPAPQACTVFKPLGDTCDPAKGICCKWRCSGAASPAAGMCGALPLCSIA